MVEVILIMATGIAIGFYIRTQKKILAYVEKAITYAIWLLLFLLGVSVGNNEVIVHNIGTLGLEAAVVAICSMGMSVLFAYGVSRFFFKHEK